MSIFKIISSLLIAAGLAACGGGGGEARTPVTSATPSTSVAVASILLTAPSPLTLSGDGTTSKTLTVRALDASGGLVTGATINLATSGTSYLAKSSVVTDSSTGFATVDLTANSTYQNTRVETITASCASCGAGPATLQIAINGASLSVTSSNGTTLTAGGNAITLSAVIKNSSGGAVAGVAVSFTSIDPTILGLSTTSGTTNSNGVATTTVSGVNNGTSSIKVTALGNDVSVPFVVNAAVGALAITSPANNATMATGAGGKTTISVAAPGATSLTFNTTLGGGVFSNLATAGSGATFTGTADFTASSAGTALIQITDSIGRSSSITLVVSPPVANKVILNASQTTVGLKTNTSTPTIRLTATALSTSGASDQPVAGVTVLFSMAGAPGGGEGLSTASQVTDSAGNAYVDFTSGTRASIQDGIVISAQITGQGSAIQTGLAPSGPSAKLTIGGQALSVAIGQSSVIRTSSDNTLYFLDHSVQVTDASGAPVANQLVTLRLRPIAFSLGSNCTVDLDSVTGVGPATYCSEDLNANGSLDSNEDGTRKQTSVSTAGQCASITARLIPGTADGLLTPQNSVGGAVPATVTTDSTGVASFSLTYLKASAIWVVDQLSASVAVNTTESSSSNIFQLPATVADGTPGASTCHLPNSPFSY